MLSVRSKNTLYNCIESSHVRRKKHRTNQASCFRANPTTQENGIGVNMGSLLFTAPNGTLPELSSPDYEFLSILSDRNKHARDHLCNQPGGGFSLTYSS